MCFIVTLKRFKQAEQGAHAQLFISQHTTTTKRFIISRVEELIPSTALGGQRDE
jgi:hypothetical protein